MGAFDAVGFVPFEFRASISSMRNLWLLLAMLGACGDDRESTAVTTYHRDVRPLMDAYCTRCHREGGEGPFALDTEDRVTTYATQIVDAVESGVMPESKDCPDFPGSFDLSDTQRAVFSSWRDSDYAIGDPTDFVALKQRCTAEL